MPSGNSITSSNAIFNLTIGGPLGGVTGGGINLYSGVQLLMFAVDDAFAAEAVDIAETQVGVDGYGVAGYRPHEVPMPIRFEAASPSILVFENWAATEDALNDKLFAQAVILQPSIGRKYTCLMGVLFRLEPMTSARRLLKDREFMIHWLPNGPGQPAISPGPM